MPRGRLDDGGLADAGGVQVNVRTLLCRFRCDIEVEDLYDISDEIWELSKCS